MRKLIYIPTVESATRPYQIRRLPDRRICGRDGSLSRPRAFAAPESGSRRTQVRRRASSENGLILTIKKEE